MPVIRDAAVTAHQEREAEKQATEEAELQAQEDAAAQHLLDTVLWSVKKNAPVVKREDLATVHTDAGSDLFVFTGPDADVHLAVRDEDGWVVRLVVWDDGWVRRSDGLETLADLGEALGGM